MSIWDFEGRTIVARCEGHQSWVSGLAFDPFKSDEKVYRFGSVGEDTRLLLWDFSVGALNRPRAVIHFFFLFSLLFFFSLSWFLLAFGCCFFPGYLIFVTVSVFSFQGRGE